ncbi:hypothetical protein [Prosthecobacter sp.]|uniref:DMP19 family protein n=1 Tax=Prosthecobacter sp. TaxID=1965333 RepID=UPI0037841511
MPLFETFQDLFDEDAESPMEPWTISEQLMALLYERVNSKNDFDAWPEPPRFYYACLEMEYQVGNGGFAQAAYNVPHLFSVAIQGHEAVGNTYQTGILREASKHLPRERQMHADKGLLDSPDLQEVFDHFADSDFSTFDGVTSNAAWWSGEELHDYARKNRASFIQLDAA